MKPFQSAWIFLKALPEQQMFTEPRPRRNLTQPPLNPSEGPVIDDYGAVSHGTVHPAILGMLQRNAGEARQGNHPTLNLDEGREQDRKLSGNKKNDWGQLRGQSIAQSPSDTSLNLFGRTGIQQDDINLLREQDRKIRQLEGQ